jgi:diguanylate cyclase (GGDEF)-like protein/PAS domain S-box-containing protein
MKPAMPGLATSANRVATAGAWRRLNHALLPDYNRKATAYWWTMVLLGAVTIAYSLLRVAALPGDTLWQPIAGVVIATLAGAFPLRIPRSTNSFAAGEIFIFLLLLLFGPAAAALASAGEALVGSWLTSKRWSSRIASPAMAAVAMFLAGSLLHWTVAELKARALFNEGMLLAASMVFAIAYFVVNTLLVTLVGHLKRNEWPQLRVFLGSFGWVGFTYSGSALIAALLELTFQSFGVGVLIAAVPIITMLLTTLHYYFRQQEASDRIREARMQAAERETARTTQHLRELELSEKRFQSAFAHAAIGMVLVSTEGRVLQANRALSVLLGRDGATLPGLLFGDLLCREDAGLLNDQLQRVLSREVEAFAVELRCADPHGRDIWVSLHCGFFADDVSTEPCLIFQVHDITARRRAEGHLQHIAYHDSLTNLANRNRFNECLLQALENQRSEPSRHFAVMYLDFDRFKLINDSLGHGAGDEFLIKVARRIQQHVRPSDVLARLGGDEFAILSEQINNTHHAVALAERLQTVLREPLLIAGKEISTSASIGITFSDFGYRTPEEVLRDADLAMYKAKAKGKAQFALFDISLHKQATEQLSLESDLRHAIGGGELSLVFQPIYELTARRLVAFEALVRWSHPQRGLIHPVTFIPLAEESGLIEPLSTWVLEQACGQLRAWQTQHPRMAHIGMHINASSKDFASTKFARLVSETLDGLDLRPSLLTLEITENALMERMESAAETMRQLRQLGVGLSIDDFGTGYSSLSYLSRLPINSLKIDRSFVRQMQGSAEDSEIVRAVITLGASLGKQVIAEGIETEGQARRLEQLGCGHGQGFLLAEPLSVRQVSAMLAGLSGEPAVQLLPADPRAADLPLVLRGAAASLVDIY